MRLAELVAASEAVAATRARLKKRDRLAELLVAAAPEEHRAVVAWLSGELVGGKLGVGWAELSRLDVLPSETETLSIADVEVTLAEIAATAGKGSTVRRRELLIALFMRATGAEQGFLRRLMVGELRQGGLDGIMMDAVAQATKIDPDRFRRAVMLAGDLPTTAALALSEGVAALDRVRATVFTPIQAMLASPSEGLVEAIAELGSIAPEGRDRAAGSGLGSIAPEGRDRAAGSGLGSIAPEGRDRAAGSGLGSIAPEGRDRGAGSGLGAIAPEGRDRGAGSGLGEEPMRPVLLEWKLDGARIQVHRDGDEVRVYTRALQEVTSSVPEIVDAVRALPATRLILDGEVIALHPDGGPRPFQETQSRFARRVDVEAARQAVPLSVFFFDLLLCDDHLWLDHPLAERRAKLHALVPMQHRVPSLECTTQEPATAFLDDAIGRGHEGVMVKSLSSPYLAGSRGRAWQKVKRVHTLDLVVLAAEWGSGRRRGWLSNIHLGAHDPLGAFGAAGAFVMLGKTFKGMTDETLRKQTEALLEREAVRDGHAVYVRPELVVEIAFDGVQASTQYPAGLALRFARVVRYRNDKLARDADTIETVRAIFDRDRAAALRAR